jgi:nucleoside-diphosphate-sugar epimerase
MKKTLVTGGAGFIGSHLVDYLINIIDSKNEGKLIDRYRNLAPLLKIQKFY